METMNPYLKRFEAWATALRAQYASDLFFRTRLQVVGLEALCALVLAGVLIASASYPAESWWMLSLAAFCVMCLGLLVVRFALTPAQETLRYQKIFISNVAHELRTPLSIIKTLTEVALIDEKLPSAARKTFIETKAELDRISEILDNLISLNTLTRAERMHLHNIDLTPLLSEVARRMGALARERDVKLIVKKSGPCVVWGNAAALEQIVSNLLKNAIGYTPKGSRGTVTVGLEREGDAVKLSVIDTGIGISQEDLFHIFEPFYRADTSRVRRVKRGGSGLGLAIVNELVRALHGKIQMQSERKKGTSVFVYFPEGRGLERQEAPRAHVSHDFSLAARDILPHSRARVKA